VEWYRPRLVDYLVRAKTAVRKADVEDVSPSTPLRDTLRGLYETLDTAGRSPTKEELTIVIMIAHGLVRDFEPDQDPSGEVRREVA
jgi:hypothetical protein